MTNVPLITSLLEVLPQKKPSQVRWPRRYILNYTLDYNTMESVIAS